MPTPLRVLSAVTLLAALAGAGCGVIAPNAPWRPISRATAPAPEQDIEQLWSRREDASCLRKAIAVYEKQFAERPSVSLCNRLAQAYFVLSELLLEAEDPARRPIHESGMACALVGLRMSGAVRRSLDRGRSLREAVGHVGKEHIGPLFWYTAHFGRWLSLQSLWTRWKHRGLVLALFDAIRRVDDRCYHGSFYGMLGCYYARLGDAERSAASFEKAIEIAPFALGARRLYALELAVRIGNRTLFVEQLTLALKQPEPDLPDVLPEFRLEQKLARKLLARVDEYFPE